MKQLIIHSLSPDQFKELVLEAIRESLAKQSLQTGKTEQSNLPASNNEVFLTRKQTAKLLQISLPTLHQYTKDGLISSFRIGNKVRYKKSDVENALTKRNYERRA